jgi:hypothetical protein
MLFQLPDYANANEIMQVFSQDKKEPKSCRGFSCPTYLYVRARKNVFSSVMRITSRCWAWARRRARGAHSRRGEHQLFLGVGHGHARKEIVGRKETQSRMLVTRR